MPLGFHAKVLWIDLTTQTAIWEPRPETFFRQWGGCGLLATKLLLETTPPRLDPFDPRNPLIFASSVIAGHNGPGLSRFVVCAKSPLTFGIGEARSEGPFAQALKQSGAEAIVFTGRSDAPVSVIIEGGKVNFLDATKLWGMTTPETTEALESKLGAAVQVAAIGPAGEKLVRFASIVTDGTFQAMRMGMGAVMGSKNLKAFAIVDGTLPEVANASGLEAIGNSFAERIAGNPLSNWQKQAPGFSNWIHLQGLQSALCVNNYSKATLEGIERFSTEEYLKRTAGVAACASCPNDCIQRIHPKGFSSRLPLQASGMHQEITGTMGPNLGITDLDWVLAANNLCNQSGLDPVSLGFALSFAMELREHSILEDGPGFGDPVGALALMKDITHRHNFGDILAGGVRMAAEQIGGAASHFAMEVKGLEMVCFDPRSQTGLALGYATSPTGPRYDIAEHDWDFDTGAGWQHSLNLARTLGIHDRIPMNELSAEKVRRYKVLNTLWSAADALGFCLFASAPTRILTMPEMASMVAAITGWQTSDYELMQWGERRNQIMRVYNLREGITASEDTLPARFFNEAVESGSRAGDKLDRTQFQAAISTYYALMGWNEKGIPTEAALLAHGIPV